MIKKQVMKALRKNIGKKVVVRCLQWGRPVIDDGILRYVKDFRRVGVAFDMPFIGEGSGVQKIIRAEDAKVLYRNPFLHDGWGQGRNVSDEERYKMMELTFGKIVASQIREEERTEKLELEKKQLELKERAKKDIPRLIKKGEPFVTPSLKTKWGKEVKERVLRDEGTIMVPKGAIKIMEALSKGKPPEKAYYSIDRRVRRKFEYPDICNIIYFASRFHPKGKKLWKWWYGPISCKGKMKRKIEKLMQRV